MSSWMFVCAYKETPKVDETAFNSETDVNVVWQVFFCPTEHDAEEYGEQCGSQDPSMLDAVGDGEAARQSTALQAGRFCIL